MQESSAPTAALRRLLEAARTRSGGCLFFVGGPGLGKTEALRQAASLAKPDFLVARARADAREAAEPSGLIRLALRSVEERSPRERPLERLLALVEDLAPRPFAVLLDDLHLADPESLDAVAYLARRTAGRPLALVFALRPWPPAALEMAIGQAAAGAAALAELQPLTPSDTAALINQHGRRPRPISNQEAVAVWESCRGNPLLAEQLAMAMVRREDWPGPAENEPHPLSRKVLLARFVGPGVPERDYLDAASVAGRRFRLAAVPGIARLDRAAADRALAGLLANGLVLPDEAGWARFAQPMLWRLVYEELPGPLRSRMHASALRTLVALGAPTDERVPHALESQAAADPEAVATLEEAARNALGRGDGDLGKSLLEVGLRLSGTRQHASLSIGLAEARLVAGRADEAAGRLRDVLREGAHTLPERIRAERLLGRALFALGRGREAAVMLEAASKEAVAAGDRELVEALIDFADVVWLSEGSWRAATALDHALATVMQLAPDLEPRVIVASAFIRLLQGDVSGLPAAETALLQADLEPRSALYFSERAWPTVPTYIQLCTMVERFGDADRAFEATLFEHGQGRLPVRLALAQADSLRRRGKLEAARQLLVAARHRAEREVELLSWVAAGEAELYLDLGLLREAGEACRTAEEARRRGSRPPLLEMRVKRARADLLVRAGRLGPAADLYAEVETIAGESGIREPCAVPWAREAVKVFVRSGRREAAERVLAWLAAAMAEVPCSWPRAAHEASLAELAGADGDREEAVERYARALESLSHVELPVEEAAVLVDYARLLRQTAQPRLARPHLARALRLAQQAGASWHQRQAHEELRAGGGRRRRQRPADELTAQETRVAALAEQGLTNVEIGRQLGISAKTVESHLRVVYSKLNVRSRRELMMRRIAERRASRGPARPER